MVFFCLFTRGIHGIQTVLFYVLDLQYYNRVAIYLDCFDHQFYSWYASRCIFLYGFLQFRIRFIIV